MPTACLSIRRCVLEYSAAFPIRKSETLIGDVNSCIIIGCQPPLTLKTETDQLHKQNIFILCICLVANSIKIERKIPESKFAGVVVLVSRGPDIRFQFEIGLSLGRKGANEGDVRSPDGCIGFVEIKI